MTGGRAGRAAEVTAVLAELRRRERSRLQGAGLALAAVAAAFAYAGLLDAGRYRGALTTILTLASESMPPDFGRWRTWGRPLLETLAMSVAGTALGSAAALPLGALAARTLGPGWLGGPARLALGALRSVPGLIWGVLFVASVGFGPSAGVFALACHSAGVLGKSYSEILEHADPAPADVLRSHGLSALGVLRFCTWPQVLPRFLDATVARWEHNVRSATTVGVVGAGGLGLQIVTAFHLFEYREAIALVAVLLALVSAIDALGARLRGWLLVRG